DFVQVTQNGAQVFKRYFDPMGNVLRTDQGDGADTKTTRYLYDQLGNLLKLQTPQGFETLHTYDVFSRLIERNYPDGVNLKVTGFQNSFKSHEMTIAGEGDQKTRLIDYDPANRVTQITDNGVALQTNQYDDPTRNGVGLLTQIQSPPVQIEYHYDISNAL